MFIGIFLGILVGSIPIMLPGMSVPMKLGLAGGPLVVAILIGRYGYKARLVTYTSTAASLMLRELGLCLFLASVGIAAGGKFVSTILSANGALWVLYGFLITMIPLLIAVVVARGMMHLNYCTIMGLVAGATTDPPALGYANNTAGNDAPFDGCSTLEAITLPRSISTIGKKAFRDCLVLKDVTSLITDPSMAIIAHDAFKLTSGDYTGRTLHVPADAVPAYQSAPAWSEFFPTILPIQ